MILRRPRATAGLARAAHRVGSRPLSAGLRKGVPVVHTESVPPDLLVAASMGYAAAPATSQNGLAQELRRRTLLRHPAAFDVFASLDRAAFVPADARASAYEDRPLPIGSRAVISAPSSHARLLDLAADFIAGRASAEGGAAGVKRVLDVGSGSGYLTAGLALLCHAHGEGTAAVGIDVHPDLVSASRSSIRAAGVDMMSRSALVGDLVRGEWAQRLLAPGPALRMMAADALSPTELGQLEPFDLIVCGGAAEAPPEALLALLRPGGRMLLALGDGPVQRLARVDRDPASNGGAQPGDDIRTTLLESAAYARLLPEGGVGNGARGAAPCAADLSAVQANLQQWQARFKEAHGRKPSHDDMQDDSRAAALLASFRQLSRSLRGQR